MQTHGMYRLVSLLINLNIGEMINHIRLIDNNKIY